MERVRGPYIPIAAACISGSCCFLSVECLRSSAASRVGGPEATFGTDEGVVKRVAMRPETGRNICAACANSCISLTQSSVLMPGARGGMLSGERRPAHVSRKARYRESLAASSAYGFQPPVPRCKAVWAVVGDSGGMRSCGFRPWEG